MSTARDRYIQLMADMEFGKRRDLWKRLLALEKENDHLKKAEEAASFRILELTKMIYEGSHELK